MKQEIFITDEAFYYLKRISPAPIFKEYRRHRDGYMIMVSDDLLRELLREMRERHFNSYSEAIIELTKDYLKWHT